MANSPKKATEKKESGTQAKRTTSKASSPAKTASKAQNAKVAPKRATSDTGKKTAATRASSSRVSKAKNTSLKENKNSDITIEDLLKKTNQDNSEVLNSEVDAQNESVHIGIKYEFKLLSLFALLVFLLISLHTNATGVVGKFIKEIFLGTFGFVGFIVPYLIFAFIFMGINKKMHKHKFRIRFSILFLFLTGTFMMGIINMHTLDKNPLNFDYISQSYINGANLIGNGAFGNVFISLLYKPIGVWGIIILLILSFVSFMIFAFYFKPTEFVGTMGKKAAKGTNSLKNTIKNKRDELVELAKARSESKSDLDEKKAIEDLKINDINNSEQGEVLNNAVVSNEGTSLETDTFNIRMSELLSVANNIGNRDEELKTSDKQAKEQPDSDLLGNYDSNLSEDLALKEQNKAPVASIDYDFDSVIQRYKVRSKFEKLVGILNDATDGFADIDEEKAIISPDDEVGSEFKRLSIPKEKNAEDNVVVESKSDIISVDIFDNADVQNFDYTQFKSFHSTGRAVSDEIKPLEDISSNIKNFVASKMANKQENSSEIKNIEIDYPTFDINTSSGVNTESPVESDLMSNDKIVINYFGAKNSNNSDLLIDILQRAKNEQSSQPNIDVVDEQAFDVEEKVADIAEEQIINVVGVPVVDDVEEMFYNNEEDVILDNADEEIIQSEEAILESEKPATIDIVRENAPSSSKVAQNSSAVAPNKTSGATNAQSSSTMTFEEVSGTIVREINGSNGDERKYQINLKNDEEEKLKPNYDNYILPLVDILKQGNINMSEKDEAEIIENAKRLDQTFKDFKIDARIVDISRGPMITRYEIAPSPGVKVSKIVGLSDDIALSLAAVSVRIVAPIPGKAAIGIEIPNKNTSIVTLKDVLNTERYKKEKSLLKFALGLDISGTPIISDLSKMPHLLIAGATGSGKSVCVNTIIASILYNAKPDEVKFLMIDPKVVELNMYNGIPHLILPVVTDSKKASIALNWAVQEMTQRYTKFAEAGVKDIASYNNKIENDEDYEFLPRIVVIIDELSDLMMVAPNQVEEAICRLAQMARACGIHLIVATQRPSVDVITGLIKANIPSRIAFAVSSQIDSRTIIDMAGAEQLLGKGDMLYFPVGLAKPMRVQGSFVSEEEIEKIVKFVSNQTEGYNTYDIDAIETVNESENFDESNGDVDPLLEQAITYIITAQKASTSLIQRKFRIGYNRAARMIEQMEERGIVGPARGSKPREVLVSSEESLN